MGEAFLKLAKALGYRAAMFNLVWLCVCVCCVCVRACVCMCVCVCVVLRRRVATGLPVYLPVCLPVC
jgi:hypothetical protein